MDCFVAGAPRNDEECAQTYRRFSPEHPFRKLYPIEMQFSRTRFPTHATDGRWIRLTLKTETEKLKPKRSTRARTKRRTRITQGERPCFAKLRSLSLLLLPSAPW